MTENDVITEAQPDLIFEDRDLASMSLQPGFVEGVIADGKRFASLEQAYRHIFRYNLENCVLLWSGIPVAFDYQEDIPAMVGPLTETLQWLLGANDGERRETVFHTAHHQFMWTLHIRGNNMSVESRWQVVIGGYEAALNNVGLVNMPSDEFVAEWKLLLAQLVKAIEDSRTQLTSESARSEYAAVKALEQQICRRGRYYRY